MVGADGQETPKEPQENDPQPLPGGADDAILEERSRDYKRDDKGRFAYCLMMEKNAILCIG